MYQLYIANKNYSSWSLRPWILMQQLGIAFEEKLQVFDEGSNFAKFRAFSPSGTVPCLVDTNVGGGKRIVWDSLAIVEYLAEHHAEVWPAEVEARTYARCAAAEMHSSFGQLRNICPMNCAVKVQLHEITPELQKDIDRIDEIWREGLNRFGGPFLGGDRFSAVDAFFCPVAYRIQSFQLPVSAESLAYSQRLLALPAMQTWDRAAIEETWMEEGHEAEILAVGEIIEDRRSA